MSMLLKRMLYMVLSGNKAYGVPKHLNTVEAH